MSSDVLTPPISVQISAISRQTIVQLKSWSREGSNRVKSPMVAGQHLPSQVGATLAGPLRVLCVGLRSGSKSCGLDLHPRTFPVGRCARTRFAQILVTIDCFDDTPRFELHLARSYAQYLDAWIVHSAAEFRAGDC
jgi:hypothetical protein